jgi:hypothetical protein
MIEKKQLSQELAFLAILESDLILMPLNPWV